MLVLVLTWDLLTIIITESISRLSRHVIKHTYAYTLTRNSSLMKYFALVTRGSSPGSGVAGRGESGK